MVGVLHILRLTSHHNRIRRSELTTAKYGWVHPPTFSKYRQKSRPGHAVRCEAVQRSPDIGIKPGQARRYNASRYDARPSQGRWYAARRYNSRPGQAMRYDVRRYNATTLGRPRPKARPDQARPGQAVRHGDALPRPS